MRRLSQTRVPAFTLTELVITVAIILILGTIASVEYFSLQSKSRDSKRKADAQGYADAIQKYQLVNGTYFVRYTENGKLGDCKYNEVKNGSLSDLHYYYPRESYGKGTGCVGARGLSQGDLNNKAGEIANLYYFKTLGWFDAIGKYGLDGYYSKVVGTVPFDYDGKSSTVNGPGNAGYPVHSIAEALLAGGYVNSIAKDPLYPDTDTTRNYDYQLHRCNGNAAVPNPDLTVDNSDKSTGFSVVAYLENRPTPKDAEESVRLCGVRAIYYNDHDFTQWSPANLQDLHYYAVGSR